MPVTEDQLDQAELLELAHDAVIITDAAGTITHWNQGARRIYGWGKGEALGQNLHTLLRTEPSSDLQKLEASLTKNFHWEGDLTQSRRNGERVVVSSRWTTKPGNPDAIRLVIGTEVTAEIRETAGLQQSEERYRHFVQEDFTGTMSIREEQLVQAQKMEGLGVLAGGIAHDFNNILAIILGFSNRLEVLGPKTEEYSSSIQAIKDGVARGAALVQQLLTSARQTEARFSALDLNGLARELAKMLQASFPKTISFDLQLDPNFPLITADRSQIQQVLLNLCVNSRDAMPQGGTLTLQTGIISKAELTAHLSEADAEAYVFMRVRDTGIGISKQIKPHLFEPFFTTKERAKGTGLGLSVVYGIVKNHRGFVQVDSEFGIGTTFSIYLPVEHSTDGPENGLTTEDKDPRHVPHTILLVEDEAMLRDLGVMNLESEGYRVLTAKDGIEAVALFEAHHQDIGLVICDLGLPRLGGREAFLKMKETRPNVRAIVASGYLEPTIRSEMLKAGVVDTIQKPYDFRDLLTKIRSVIGEEATSEIKAE